MNSSALRFVLNDLGWEGYLGFVEDGRDRLHVGCSPGSREFFAAVYRDALAGCTADSAAPFRWTFTQADLADPHATTQSKRFAYRGLTPPEYVTVIPNGGT